MVVLEVVESKAKFSRKLLDHGFVNIVDIMGDDYRILQSARVSTGGEASKGEKQDRGLIRYLYKNEHHTPFEQVSITLHVKCPIFVARQWMRHRTMSYNEYSGRYSPMIDDYYTPEQFYYQSDTNHQSSGKPLEPYQNETIINEYTDLLEDVRDTYETWLQDNIANEQARMPTSVTNYTEFYATVNLRNLFHFIELRTHYHAQYEIQVYGEALLEMLEEYGKLKWSVAVFKEFRDLKWAYMDAIAKCKSNTEPLKELLENFVIVKNK